MGPKQSSQSRRERKKTTTDNEENLRCTPLGEALERGPGGPGPIPNILVGWATMHLDPPTPARSLILRKICKIGATRFQILMQKVAFRWGILHVSLSQTF